MSTGLDTYIDNAISLFEDSLWVGFNNQFLGRSYRLTKDGNVRPHIYDTVAKNRKYKEVFASNKFDSIVHFDVEPNGETVGNSQQLLNVNILFAVNLSKIYGDDIRSVEQCKKDISDVLQYTSFNYTGYVDQLPAYSDLYGLTTDQEFKFNMQPFYIIRFETTIMVGSECVATTPTIKRPLTISIDGDGVTVPAVGRYSIENGETQQLVAAENSGSEFVKIVENEGEVNEVTYLDRVVNLLMDSRKIVKAYFQTIIQYFTLTMSSGEGGTITPIAGDHEIEQNTIQTIEAIPNDDRAFEKWLIDSVEELSNPYDLLVDSNKEVIASFIRTDLATYLQWIFLGKTTDIVGSTVVNAGTGETDADVVSFNQTITSDGSLVITFDSLTAIDDFNGTATPTINGNTIEVSVGQLYDITVDGVLYPLIESKGLNIWGVDGNSATLNTVTGVWDNLNELAINHLYKLGGELYISDTVSTDKIRVIKGTSGFITPTITGYTKDSEYEPNAGAWSTNTEFQNQDNVGLNALFTQYGLPLKNSDGWFDFNTLIGFNGYPYPTNVVQAFLKEDPIFDGNELKDYSNTPVNATVYGRYLNLASTATATLINNIIVDYSTDGVKYEFIASLKGVSASALTAEVGDDEQGLGIETAGIRITFNTTGGFQTARFANLVIPDDSIAMLFKIETVGGVLHGSLTDINDANYSNAVTDTIDLSTIIGLLPSEVYKFGGSAVYTSRSDLIYGRINDIKFSFELGNQGFHIGSINSPEHGFLINNFIFNQNWQSQKIFSLNGSSTVYYKYNGVLRFINVPNYEGEDAAKNTVAYLNFLSDNHGVDISSATSEDDGTGLTNGWSFKLDPSMEIYDQDNTYFTTGSVANYITANLQPSRLNSRIFYDNENQKNLTIYDADVDIITPFNLVNVDMLLFGDSMSNKESYPKVLIYKTGVIPTTNTYYGGKTTAQQLALLEAAVVSDPTLVSDKKIMTIQSGANDYGQNVSEAQILIDLEASIQYLRLQNPTAPLIMISPYNYDIGDTGALDDGTTPNSAGLTLNGIRAAYVAKVAEHNNTYLCNWNDANILYSDLSDVTHAYTAGGALKCTNKLIETINTIKEGTITSPIPEADYRQTLNEAGNVITDIAVLQQ